MTDCNQSSPPPYSPPFPAPPSYSPPRPAMSPPIPSIWQRSLRFLGGNRDHSNDLEPEGPVPAIPPARLPLSSTDSVEGREPSFDIFQQIPTKTISTLITAWGNLDLTSNPDVELKVTMLTHRKCLVSEYQHEFLLMQVHKPSTSLTFDLVVQRSLNRDNRRAKTHGPAYDTLLVLSENDKLVYTSATTVSTLSWDMHSPPPLHHAIKLLCLVSSNFPQYIASHYNCYHYAVVGSIVLETYRHATRPDTTKGIMTSKGSRFLTMKMLHAEEVYIDAITVIVQYYQELLTGVTLGKGKGKAV